ncbi:AcrR family transcriptional regulator [Kitasatospora gansuensis]|uniref:AcrR family transcriptional regulator n=1 Tax=Kitasatospora gansuensis TaxID=258050 RepID=A0A7W7WJC0_9ACTN|nr:TetR/AcrR family transcriptional regulator [Kitasatospora gansuensis]MBB4948988.1 AcrR family transcriptional regulator [Kitasatospora gansuensis]
MSTRGPRGPYAKSAAKRQQIIEAALAAYAEAGSRGVSVREIAERVGMTDAGVLHHFGGREALLTAVLEARDVAAAERHGEEGTLWRPELLAENVATPGLVKLFVDLAAAAAEPGHPAHAYFTERYATLRERVARALTEGRPDGGAEPPARPDVDADWAARVLLAATDGLQLQWLLDPSVDMAADLLRLRDVVLGALDDAGSRGDN